MGVFRAWGVGGGRRIGVLAYSGWISASRRILGLGGRGGISVSAYRYSGSGVGGGGDWRIGVVPFSGHVSGASAYSGLGGRWGAGGRRIGVLSFSGRPAAHRRIGVFWAWGVVGAGIGVWRIIVFGATRIGVSAYSGPGGRGGWRGGSAYQRMGVFWAWGVGGRWIGVSAYRRVGAARRRIGVFWA